MVSSQAGVFTSTLITMLSLLERGSCIISGISWDKMRGSVTLLPRLKYPFLVNIQYLTYFDGWRSEYKSICGGTILDQRTILTSAHCFDSTQHCSFTRRNCFRIVAGTNDLSAINDKHEQVRTFPLSAIRKHENYSQLNHDIALIHLPHELELDEYVEPINLVDPDRDYKREGAGIAGWGKARIEQGSTYDPNLHEAKVNIYSEESCTRQWGDKFQPENILCASGIPGGPGGLSPDACQGDSGGPLVAEDLEEPEVKYVVGIIGWGYGCGNSKFAGVYTKVETYLPWIREMRRRRGKRVKRLTQTRL